jgi:hypothetical protein
MVIIYSKRPSHWWIGNIVKNFNDII